MGLLAALDNAKLLAGGQSLMPMLNLRLLAPDHVIDINRIPELSGIRVDRRDGRIGAMTRQVDLQASENRRSVAPIFRKALAHVGHYPDPIARHDRRQLCHLDPAAELPALCALLDAEFDVVGPNGARTVMADDWFQGYLQSALERERAVARDPLAALAERPWLPVSTNMPAAAAISRSPAPRLCSKSPATAASAAPRSWCSASSRRRCVSRKPSRR